MIQMEELGSEPKFPFREKLGQSRFFPDPDNPPVI
jgi:hypothetical protein